MVESVRVSLASWLLERLADEEKAAHAASADQVDWLTYTSNYLPSFGEMRVFADRQSPARVLAECAARRQIIELHEQRYNECSTCGNYAVCDEDGPGIIGQDWPCRTLRLLAAPYASEPGYRAEWAV